jgi:hypothetical protein
MGFMRHMITKIGPPVDRERFTMSAIRLATVKSLVKKLIICVSDSHASAPFTLCLLPASSINEGCIKN